MRLHVLASHSPQKMLLSSRGLITYTGSLRKACYTRLMSVLCSDTHPKMEALQIQLWRQASPTRKMQMLAQLNASVRILALTGLRSRYPQASEPELRRRLGKLLLGEELARKIYGEIEHAE